MQTYWSEEDHSFIAIVHELPGCMADGQTQHEALANIQEIIKEWIEVASEEKREIPKSGEERKAVA